MERAISERGHFSELMILELHPCNLLVSYTTASFTVKCSCQGQQSVYGAAGRLGMRYALLDDRATVLEERQTVIFPLIIGFPVDNISPSSKSTLSGVPLDIAVTSVVIIALI